MTTFDGGPSRSQPRSWLFTPAMRPDRFDAAGRAGADVLIMDLEDAVAPRDKDVARANALAALAGEQRSGPALALRVNALRTPTGLADVLAVLQQRAQPDYLVVPKAESADELSLLDDLLSAVGSPARLVALIESAPGLGAAAAVARSTGRLAALMFGAADCAADLGAATAWEPLLFSRAQVVAAAATAGIEAIDAPCFALRDPAALEAELTASRALGFASKAAIHPSQVAAINAAFTPTNEQVAWARRILVENDKGIGVVDGQMIDEAVARKARRLLRKAGVMPDYVSR